MADMVHLLHTHQLNGAAAKSDQPDIASSIRSGSLNVRGQHKTTLFQGYQGNGYREVGDLHIYYVWEYTYVHIYTILF